MVFGNAQVHLGVKAHSGLGGHGIPPEGELEFLLVHGGGGQQGGLHPLPEPVGGRASVSMTASGENGVASVPAVVTVDNIDGP